MQIKQALLLLPILLPARGAAEVGKSEGEGGGVVKRGAGRGSSAG